MDALVISDVHGNKPALDAVMNDVGNVDTIICLGDVVGYGPFPRECVEWMQENADIMLQGNHDREVLQGKFKGSRQDIYQSRKLARDELSDQQINWLQKSPERRAINGHIYAAHSHPSEQYTDTHMSPRDYEDLLPFIEEPYELLLIGHTHLQSSKTFSDVTVMNPGSVGQPRDNTVDASYALLDLETSEFEFRRTPYNIDAVRDKCIDLGQPEKNYKRLYKR